jgi:iron complex outermembrane recepter protein
MVRIPEFESARPVVVTAAAMVAMLMAAHAGAQTQPAAVSASTATNAQTQSLQQVVVTAQRRAQPIQNVPITITYLSAQQLTQAGVTNFADIAALTPGLTNYFESGFYQPAIRGVGTLILDSGGGTNVGTYVDGFYMPNPEANDFQLLNMQSVQVLKGPQGTLFGRNTTGGAILVNTSPPSTTTNVIANVDYSSFNTQKYETYFTTGITHDLAFDIAGMLAQSDGWVHNIALDNRDAGAYQNYSMRTGLFYTPTDNLSFLLRFYHASTRDPSNMLYSAYEEDGVPQVYGRFIPGTIITTSPYEVAYDDEPSDFKFHQNIFQLTTKYDFGVATLTSYTQYQKQYGEMFMSEDFDSFRAENLDITVADPRTFSQEFLVNSQPGTRLQWTAGAFIFDDRDLWPTLGQIFDSPMELLAGSASTDREFAGYFDLTYQLTPHWFLTGGFRYTHDEYSEGDYYLNPADHVPEILFPTLSNNRGTPRAVLRYQINPQSSIYASFSTGFKAAIFNVGGGDTTPILPESLKAYEIGYKLAAQRVTASLSSYFYNYNDLQVESYAVINEVPVSLVNNAATARIWGADGALDVRVTSAFQVHFSAAYTHAIYVDYAAAPDYTECLNLTACGTSYGLYATGVTNASGLEMPNAPKFTGTVAPVYTIEVPDGSSVALSANYYYTSSYYFDSADHYEQHPYSTLGVRAAWTSASGHWSTALYGNNVTDTHYYTQILPGTFGIGAVWAEPTSIGVSVSYRLQ